MTLTHKLNPKITLQPTFDYKILMNALGQKSPDMQLIMTNSARSSLYLSLQSLLNANKKINRILLPDLICSEIIPLIIQYNLNIIFYSIDGNLNPDINFIEDNIKNKSSIILVVNYFGKPSDWNSILDLKKHHDCTIIEDNAHSLFGSYKNINYGDLGDISFNSLRKVMPVLSGSILKFNNECNLTKTLEKRLLSFSEFKYSLRGMKLYSSKKIIKKNINSNKTIYDKTLSIDYLSKKIYTYQYNEKHKICLQRKMNYQFWKNYLKNSELDLIDISSSICPYAMPCIYNDNESYDRWLTWGIKNNINIIKWPLLPVLDSYRLKNKALANILLFPVNHMHDLASMDLSDA